MAPFQGSHNKHTAFHNHSHRRFLATTIDATAPSSHHSTYTPPQAPATSVPTPRATTTTPTSPARMCCKSHPPPCPPHTNPCSNTPARCVRAAPPKTCPIMTSRDWISILPIPFRGRIFKRLNGIIYGIRLTNRRCRWKSLLSRRDDGRAWRMRQR